MQQRSPSPEAPPVSKDSISEETNPELAKYLNRSYWEQRKVSDSPMASPSAPSPMPPTPQSQMSAQSQISLTANDFRPKTTDEQKIDEFAANMRAQVEIFVNRMKSNSSRGRSISNDSSVQTLFMALTNLHSEQLSYIKELDDKRMWYEQLQDKLAQIKDSRAALDDLRHEHAEKLRRMAEEQERQRQIQMAQKLEIMRKKKQEYLQYQRQLALHRIQEQEREMQMRQEQQMAQYRMNQTAFPFMPNMTGVAPPQGSQLPQMPGVYNPYSPNPTTAGAAVIGMPPYTTQAGMTGVLPGMYTHATAMPGQPQQPPQMMLQQQPQPINQQQLGNHMNNMMGRPLQMGEQQQQTTGAQQQQPQQIVHTQPPPTTQQQQQQQQQQQMPPQQQQQPQLAHVMLQQQTVMHAQSPIPNIGSQAPPQQQQTQSQTAAPVSTPQAASQIQAVQSAPAPPQNAPEPAAPPASEEPATAELISFD